MKHYLIFCDQAPNGIIVRDVDLKHWKDATSYAVEVDSSLIDDLQNELDDQDETLSPETSIKLPSGRFQKIMV